jgi:hypothetical protein
MEAIMPLTLNFRDVAQRNIDEFDRLGGFHGQTVCRYRYDGPGNLGCAIGICFPPDFHLSSGYNGASIRDINDEGSIVTDSTDALQLMQSLHDYRAQDTAIPFPHFYCGRDFGVVPFLRRASDLTPELYKEIMAKIAALPADRA